MSHREDLLEGAVSCLREKGYARTTARDIVKASGTNLASIGYHYGSTEALLNAAVFRAMEDFGAEIGRSMTALGDAADATLLERFERFWEQTIASFKGNPGVWLATIDIFGVALRNPELRAAIADGLDDGRQLWAQALYQTDLYQTDQHHAEDDARAIGSLHQALLSGVLVQWLMDPERAPSAADLARALSAIAERVAADQANARLWRPARAYEVTEKRGGISFQPLITGRPCSMPIVLSVAVASWNMAPAAGGKPSLLAARTRRKWP